MECGIQIQGLQPEGLIQTRIHRAEWKAARQRLKISHFKASIACLFHVVALHVVILIITGFLNLAVMIIIK